jgi:hypothetical protein
MTKHATKVLGEADNLLVVTYDTDWLDFCILSDLSAQVIISVDDVDDVVKELKKFKKRADKESL